ncbi:hypothetical protein J2755_000731 [Methanohalophilus levihalophilus]|uniref:PEF-CTERM sorting domain-containing protein n=1 Tax=Methanohalophilus levihalophilus TaxID=1431282 RepID=UPI001AEAB84B|nr:PEF-CTERM sorting domain-containing protein [Methanohalophilus levihalophilus]MBP2029811.1 hypothetical protein [Methanohalophilus levihalophilus]
MLKKIIIAMLVLAVAIPLATAASVEPTYFPSWTPPPGGPEEECKLADSCGEYAYKIEPWNETTGANGTYTHAGTGNTITITNSNGTYFDWESDDPVCTVIVKAATSANVYSYGAAYNDTGLVPPSTNAISHVTFCFNSDFEIPEFPTVALPIAAILGLAFIFTRRRNE